jgi:hypothetical protein
MTPLGVAGPRPGCCPFGLLGFNPLELVGPFVPDFASGRLALRRGRLRLGVFLRSAGLLLRFGPLLLAHATTPANLCLGGVNP